MKVEAFMKHLRSGVPFGAVVADLYTMEFQKRGLPHCHTLLWVNASHKIKNPCDVDDYISAQIPDPKLEPVLHKILTDFMLHGLCGLAKPTASCMLNDVCSKHFPKTCEHATRFDKEGYVHYKRKVDGFSVVKNNVTFDDAFAVPYNKDLLLRFDAHINVEYCGWNMVIKYLFKYISKGADRIHFTITKPSSMSTVSPYKSTPLVDEVKNFLTLASFVRMRLLGEYLISPSTAEIQLFNFWPSI